jgi:hypothetical protein
MQMYGVFSFLQKRMPFIITKAKYKYSNPEEASNVLIHYFSLKKNALNVKATQRKLQMYIFFQKNIF